MKTTNKRTGFTLVELLVVISIIAMLAGLLLPAIQAARENGRRIVCVSQQSQVAYALLNYEHTRSAFPALRAPMQPANYTPWVTPDPLVPNLTELTWVGFLLPYIEQNTAWDHISNNMVGSADHPVYDLVLPVFKCKSSGISPNESKINYVVNAGPQNADAATVAGSLAVSNFWITGGNGIGSTRNVVPEYNFVGRKESENKMYGVFFDHFATVSDGTNTAINHCDTRVTLEYISSQDGTSQTILLSENADAGHWIWHDPGGPIAYATGAALSTNTELLTHIEDHVAFCYPQTFVSAVIGGITVADAEPVYIPLTITGGTDAEFSPLFINEGRAQSGIAITYQYRKARPSSGHPGVVVAAFCDRSTRVLKDDMDKALFVRLCRPSSGVVVNPKDLD